MSYYGLDAAAAAVVAADSYSIDRMVAVVEPAQRRGDDAAVDRTIGSRLCYCLPSTAGCCYCYCCCCRCCSVDDDVAPSNCL